MTAEQRWQHGAKQRPADGDEKVAVIVGDGEASSTEEERWLVVVRNFSMDGSEIKAATIAGGWLW